VEEPPITTIVPRHRFMKVRPNMVLALIHSPLVIKGLGQMKKKIHLSSKEDGELEPLTYLPCEKNC